MTILKCFSGCIKSDYLDLAAVAVRDACFIKSSHSAEGHVVVLAVQNIDVTVFFKIFGHDLVSFCFSEVTVELACDLPVGMLCYCIFKSLCTLDLRGRTDRSLKMKYLNVSIFRDLFFQPFNSKVSLTEEVRADVCKIETVIFDGNGSVHDDYWNTGILNLSQDRLPAFFNCRRNDNKINAFKDEAADSCELVLLLLSCIFDNEFIFVIICKCVGHGFCVCHTPVGFGTDL